MYGSLEIGGSHLTTGLVDPRDWTVQSFARHPLDPTAPLARFIATVRLAVSTVDALPARWAVAIPGPFDYAAGVGGRHPAGKLRALAGLDVRAVLAPVLGTNRITFVNDAVAFGLGAFRLGAVDGVRPGLRPPVRLLGLTLGSGIGSAFVEAGRLVTDERVPPGGEVYALPAGPGITLEERFGPAALARTRGFATFRELAAYARTDAGLAESLRDDFRGLADSLAPWLRSFAPDSIACAGGACGAWDVIGQAFADRLIAHAGAGVIVRHIRDLERTAMRGAVAHAASGVE